MGLVLAAAADAGAVGNVFSDVELFCEDCFEFDYVWFVEYAHCLHGAGVLRRKLVVRGVF